MDCQKVAQMVRFDFMLKSYSQPRAKNFLVCFFLFIFVFGVFSRSLSAGFVEWDDDINIYENKRIANLDKQNLAWMFLNTSQALRYKPLSWFSWALIHAQAGNHPFYYHLLNVFFHAINGALVFLLIKKLLDKSDKPTGWLSMAAAIFGALLWSMHPLRVEAVAWATGMPYCQSCCFLLISTLSYLKSGEAQHKWNIYYWISVFAFLVALLTYPIVLGFLPVLLALDFWNFRRIPDDSSLADRIKKACLEKLPFVFVTFLFLSIALYARIPAEGKWSNVTPLSLGEFGISARAMQAFYIWAYYVWKPLVPLDLSPVYTTLISFRPFELRFLISFLFVTGLTALLLWKWRRWSLILGLWICHLALLVPATGITEHPHFPSDRYCYIASICWSVMAAALIKRAMERTNTPVLTFVGSGLVVLVLVTISIRQIGIWQNSVKLFTHMIEKLGNDPYRADMYWRLGEVHLKSGNPVEAAQAYGEFLQFHPENVSFRKKLADICFTLNRVEEAKAHYAEAIRHRPNDSNLYNDFAVELAIRKDFSAAATQFQEALQIDPSNADVY
jgi:tetratricopeptide (TPR) repeat protein